VSYQGLYSPDVIAEKAYGFIDEAALHPEPWFLGIAPIAPHSNAVFRTSPPVGSPPKYAPRHAHLFKDYVIPRTSNFNPDTPSGVSRVRILEKLNETVVEYNDEFQRSRLRALQAVDEMVEGPVKRLEEKGILDNTCIFYTTDNGYHISQWRMPPGKECPYETDIHIPLIIRGPDVPCRTHGRCCELAHRPNPNHASACWNSAPGP
jgi:N-acetylglucosamine-6-sulfatase